MHYKCLPRFILTASLTALFTALLAVSFAACSPAAVQTAHSESEEPSMQLIGTVLEISENQIHIDGGDAASVYDDTILNFSEETLILSWPKSDIDTELLPKVKTPEEITSGDLLYAYVSPNMTRSIPPIANASLILCDVDMNGSAPFYGTITEITTDGSGNLNFHLDCDLVLIPGPETLIRRLENSEAAEAASSSPAANRIDLQAGDTVLAGCRFVTMSIPAMSNPDIIWIIR